MRAILTLLLHGVIALSTLDSGSLGAYLHLFLGIYPHESILDFQAHISYHLFDSTTARTFQNSHRRASDLIRALLYTFRSRTRPC